jgi:hypothetical protein
MGMFIADDDYRTSFHPALERLKQDHFPHNPDEPVVLHRKDMINRTGPFWRLRHMEAERAFNAAFLQFLGEQDFRLITVVIDKKAHIERYGTAAFHPYHYCLVALLERYCGFLNRFGAQGDVMAEARGGKEDDQLAGAYRTLWANGTQFRSAEFFQRVLTSKEIKMCRKEQNIAGLQVADLLAYPCKQDILIENLRINDPGDIFGKQVCQCVAAKYNRRLGNDQVAGYGKVFLK